MRIIDIYENGTRRFVDVIDDGSQCMDFMHGEHGFIDRLDFNRRIKNGTWTVMEKKGR